MSEIADRLMRGDYISKVECLEHADELQHTLDVYGPAMDAMERAMALPSCVRCDGENGYADAGHCDICAVGPFCGHCMSRHEGIDGECSEEAR